jgi:hypothetical protein
MAIPIYFLAGTKAVAVVNAETLETQDVFQADKRVAAVQTDTAGKVLYVLQAGWRSMDGLEQDTEGEVVVTNLMTRSQRRYPAGRRAFLLAAGQDGQLMVSAAAGFSGAKKEPRYRPGSCIPRHRRSQRPDQDPHDAGRVRGETF